MVPQSAAVRYGSPASLRSVREARAVHPEYQAPLCPFHVLLAPKRAQDRHYQLPPRRVTHRCGKLTLEMLAASDPEAPPETWRSYRQILQEGFKSIDRRLQDYGPLEPEYFNLEEANQRLAKREDLMRWRRS